MMMPQPTTTLLNTSSYNFKLRKEDTRQTRFIVLVIVSEPLSVLFWFYHIEHARGGGGGGEFILSGFEIVVVRCVKCHVNRET